MFTGIVQAKGTVRSVRPTGNGVRLVLDAPGLPRPISNGASVCVSGVCLTVTRCDAQTIEFDVVAETLSRSTLGGLKPGDRVNLERSLRAADRLDGHIVQGHVDGTAIVSGISSDHTATFEATEDLRTYIIPKGSIAIDGVSLTIADVSGRHFSVALIPSTLAETTLGNLRVGDRVNIETDILARTVVTTLRRWRDGSCGHGITMDLLQRQGYA
ncbi:MAG TPA: riboflavin synthase [Phycisphaerae bacterium]|nr:riboflavin synthase [Phycisphaerae bacterium]HRR86973.1 riboflavin synthase [Phycisphaerae bacterium]